MDEISDDLIRTILNEHPNVVAIMIVDHHESDEPRAYFAGRLETPQAIEAYLFGILMTHQESDGYSNVVRKEI